MSLSVGQVEQLEGVVNRQGLTGSLQVVVDLYHAANISSSHSLSARLDDIGNLPFAKHIRDLRLSDVIGAGRAAAGIPFVYLQYG